MSWFCSKSAPEPEPTPSEPSYDYSDHVNVSGRAPGGDSTPDLPRAEGTDPGEPMPYFPQSREFPGGAPGLGKRR